MKDLRSSTVLALAVLLVGCATPANHYDPLESINRPIFTFNQKADQYLMKPVAKGYRAITPKFIQRGVSNFFGNISDLFTAGNDVLQGKGKQAGQDTLRVLLNSTLGIAGLFDVATPMGLEKHDEDFGQTLGKWGLGSGPYLVLPFLGPSTLRDSSNYVVSYYASPLNEVSDGQSRYSLVGLNAVDTRAKLLGTDELLDDALDPYTFLRDAWLQRRHNLVHDGQPPAPLDMGEDDSPDDEALEPAASAPANEPPANTAPASPVAPAAEAPVEAAPAP